MNTRARWIAQEITIGIVLAFALLAAPGSIRLAQAAPTNECTVGPDHPIFDAVSWYGLYWDGAKVGHMNGNAVLVAGDSIVVNTDLEMTIGDSFTRVSEHKRFGATPPHTLVSGTVDGSNGKIEFRQMNDGIEVTSVNSRHRIPKVRWTICDEESVSMTDQLAELTEVGARFDSINLDVEALEITRFEHVLESVEQQRIGKEEHVFQSVLSRVHSKGMTNRLRQRYRDGEAITLQLGPFEARLETKEQALGPIEPTDQIELLTVESIGRLNTKSIANIKALTVKVTIDDPLARIQDVVRDGQMQRVQYLDERSATVRIADYSPEPKAPRNEEDVSPYLAANFTYPTDHPRIVDLAKSLRESLPTGASDQLVAQLLLTYVAKKIRYELVGTKTVLTILDDPVGDCTEYAQLLVTLARANGLPAREVTGFIYYQNDPDDENLGQFGGHAWVEIFIDGQWQHMDPTANEIYPNKSHVQFKQFMVRELGFEILDVQYN